eukprot:3336340-Lingulodinium_polyedra.AAC.1
MAAAQPQPWESGIPAENLQAVFPMLRALHCREFDLLQHKWGVAYPESKRRTINLSPSIEWSCGREDHSMTLTGSCRMFLTD